MSLLIRNRRLVIFVGRRVFPLYKQANLSSPPGRHLFANFKFKFSINKRIRECLSMPGKSRLKVISSIIINDVLTAIAAITMLFVVFLFAVSLSLSLSLFSLGARCRMWLVFVAGPMINDHATLERTLALWALRSLDISIERQK